MAEIYRFRRLRHAGPARPGLAGPARQRRGNDRLALFWLTVLAFFIAAGVGSLVLPYLPGLAARPAAVSVAAQFGLCGGGARVTCVVDGDTFWLSGTKYRIADIDTPEVSEPQCPAERDLGQRATARLRTLLNVAPFALERIERDEDVYGRKLRVVRRDGVSLGEMLVAEGLAHRWDGGQRGWC